MDLAITQGMVRYLVEQHFVKVYENLHKKIWVTSS